MTFRLEDGPDDPTAAAPPPPPPLPKLFIIFEIVWED